MKMWEINQLPRADIEEKLQDSLEEFQNLRFQHATKQLDDPTRLSLIRKTIARLHTVLREMDRGTRAEQASGS